MKFIKSLFILGLIVSLTYSAQAIAGMLATQETITQLRKDLREGHVRIGKTRLHEVIDASVHRLTAMAVGNPDLSTAQTIKIINN